MEQYEESKIIKMLSNPKTKQKAFGMVVNQYTEKMYWQIRRIVITHDDANDVLQNSFMKAWKNIDSFRNDSKLSTWLFRIAVNESLDFMRHKNTLSILSTDDTASQETQGKNNAGLAAQLRADEYFDGNDIEIKLQEAIAQLPDVQRTVFNMRYFDDMKYSEMSMILNTTEGALKASYHIAVKKIYEYFQSHD